MGTRSVGAPAVGNRRYYGWGRVGKVVELTVLRRSFVRTRTSTTPVWMGSMRIRSVCAPAVGNRRYYGGDGGNLETTANAVADSDWASAEFLGVKFWFYENLL